MNDTVAPAPVLIKLQYMWIATLVMPVEAGLTKEYVVTPGQVIEVDNLQDAAILEGIIRPPAGCCGTNQGPRPYFVRVEN